MSFGFSSLDRPEPPHVHVRGHGGFAKVWLVPAVQLQYSRGYSRRQIERIFRVTEAHRDEWVAAWHAYFSRD